MEDDDNVIFNDRGGLVTRQGSNIQVLGQSLPNNHGGTMKVFSKVTNSL